jgi:hypothetical protein
MSDLGGEEGAFVRVHRDVGYGLVLVLGAWLFGIGLDTYPLWYRYAACCPICSCWLLQFPPPNFADLALSQLVFAVPVTISAWWLLADRMRSRGIVREPEAWRSAGADILLGLAVWTALLLLLWTVGFWNWSWYVPWFFLVMGFAIASLVGMPLVAMATGGLFLGADMRSLLRGRLNRVAR